MSRNIFALERKTKLEDTKMSVPLVNLLIENGYHTIENIITAPFYEVFSIPGIFGVWYDYIDFVHYIRGNMKL